MPIFKFSQKGIPVISQQGSQIDYKLAMITFVLVTLFANSPPWRDNLPKTGTYSVTVVCVVSSDYKEGMTVSPLPTRETLIWKDWETGGEIWIKCPKWTNMAMARALFDPWNIA